MHFPKYHHSMCSIWAIFKIRLVCFHRNLTQLKFVLNHSLIFIRVSVKLTQCIYTWYIVYYCKYFSQSK